MISEKKMYQVKYSLQEIARQEIKIETILTENDLELKVNQKNVWKTLTTLFY